ADNLSHGTPVSSDPRTRRRKPGSRRVSLLQRRFAANSRSHCSGPWRCVDPPPEVPELQLAPAPPPLPAARAETPKRPDERWLSVSAPIHRKALSLLLAAGPPLTAVFVTVRAVGGAVPWLNLILLTAFYFVIAHGVTIGFHRLFTHR